MKYAALAVGVVAGLAVAPITLTANATTTGTCGDIITEQSWARIEGC